MKEIPVGDHVAIVDDRDFNWLSQWKWRPMHNGRNSIYAIRQEYVGGGRRKSILMHRVIMGEPVRLQVDEITSGCTIGAAISGWRRIARTNAISASGSGIETARTLPDTRASTTIVVMTDGTP